MLLHYNQRKKASETAGKKSSWRNKHEESMDRAKDDRKSPQLWIHCGFAFWTRYSWQYLCVHDCHVEHIQKVVWFKAWNFVSYLLFTTKRILLPCCLDETLPMLEVGYDRGWLVVSRTRDFTSATLRPRHHTLRWTSKGSSTLSLGREQKKTPSWVCFKNRWPKNSPWNHLSWWNH